MADLNKLSKDLYEIVNDLWHDESPIPAAAETSGGEAPRETVPPPFETFWKRSDETVEWTEALSLPEPPDRLTDPETWHFYHERAGRVLDGDTAAYADVMRRMDPLGDLEPYVGRITAVCESSDLLEVTFEALPEQMTAEGGRHYLSGVALRCARDMAALLPVTEIGVTGMMRGQTLLRVRYVRAELQRVKFDFVDPAAYTESVGGVFTEDAPVDAGQTPDTDA